MSPGTRFVIAGTQRTGTTLVRTSLSSHPRVLCHGEVFKLGKRPYTQPDGYWAYSRRGLTHRLRSWLSPQRSAATFLDELYAETAHDAVGFKLMLSHCLARPYLWALVRGHAPKVILVRRQNVLKTLLSRLAAAASGVYHVSGDKADAHARPAQVRVDTRSLIGDLQAIDSEPEQWRERLGDMPYLEIVYEDYIRSVKSTNDRVLGFLGVETVDLASDLQKVNVDDLSQLIDNYAEVAAALAATKFARCLAAD
jgi:LPS sulfotransferase NodH